MRLKTIKWLATMAIIGALLLPGIALAYIYEAPFTVAETSGNVSYNMLPVFVASPNQYLIDNGFMRADAQDTSVETLGGAVKPRMVTDNMTFTAIPVAANSQTNLKFKTGQSNTNMQIIVGHDGYITVSDNTSLELGSDSEVEVDAYVETSAGANKNLVNKTGAFRTYISASANITSELWAWLRWTTPTGDNGGWNNPANAYDDNVVSFADDNVLATSWSGWLELTHATLSVSSISYYAGGDHVDIDQIDVDVWYDGDWHGVYLGPFVQGAWETRALPVVSDNVTIVRLRLYNSGGAGHNAYIYEVDFGEAEDVSVMVSGVASGEHTVKTVVGEVNFIDGDALHFDGSATSNVNPGNILNGAKLWVSFWFNLDADHGIGGAQQRLISKTQTDGVTFFVVHLNNGYLEVYHASAGSFFVILSIPQTTYTAGTWYHVIASLGQSVGGGAATDGARLRVDNGVPKTSANTTALNNTGDFIIGNTKDGTAGGMVGHIARVVVGIDDLSAAEEAALYNGIAPGDEVEYWYIDEGTGTSIISYGSTGTAGTADTNTGWVDTNTPCNFYIDIDGTEEDGANMHATGASVLDNANDWTISDNNTLPYITFYKQTVGGTLIAHYEPDTYIIGNNLPDLETAVSQNGTIMWGANPANVTVTLGSLLSIGQPDIGQIPETPSRDLLGETAVSDWFVEPDVTGSLLTNPIRPFVTLVSDNTALTELQTWRWLGIAFVLLVTGLCIRVIKGHLVIACIGAGAATVVMVVLTIFPMWTLVFLVLYALGGWVSERSPSL